MTIVPTILNAVFVLSAGAWLGASILLAVVVPQIESAMKGRRTEARQLLARLLGTFQKIELGLMAGVWLSRAALTVLVGVWPERFAGVLPAAVAALVLLLVPTLAAAYATGYLTRAVRKQEAQLGSYADKNEQIRVRKRIGALLKQAEVLTWLKAVTVAGVLVAGVVAMGNPDPAPTTQPTTATAPAEASMGAAETQPATAPAP